MRLTTIFLCVFSPVFSAAFAQTAQPTNVDELVAFANTRAMEIRSWTADLTAKSIAIGPLAEFSGTTERDGLQYVTIMNGNVHGKSVTFRLFSDPDGIGWNVIESDGKTEVVLKTDMAEIAKLGDEGKKLGSLRTNLEKLADFAYLEPTLNTFSHVVQLSLGGTTDLDGVPVYIVQGTVSEQMHTRLVESRPPDSTAPIMQSVKVYVGKDDGLVHGVDVLDSEGGVYLQQRITNVVLNPAIDETHFVYTPPDGVTVTDKTDLVKQNIAASQSDSSANGNNQRFSIGDTPPDFEATLIDGTPFKLSDLRGKVVLLDFWATWCPPCMRELPNVVSTYGQYHDDNFEIVGVSLDHNADTLKMFLKDHPEVSWPQVYSEGAWNAAVPTLYGVNAIPFALLLDTDGVIRGMSLRGEALGKAIAELLDMSEN